MLDERDLRAHTAEELRELHADGAAAENDQADRDARCPDGVPVRPVMDVLEPVDRRNRRLRAGRDDELVVLELAVSDGHDSRTGNPRLAAHELRLLVCDPARVPRVVATVRHLVAPPPHALVVELARYRLGRARSQPRGGQRLDRAQQASSWGDRRSRSTRLPRGRARRR